MIIRRSTWFTFHILTDLVAAYVTPLRLIQFKLDHSGLVHEIVRCLPSEEDLRSEKQATELAEASVTFLKAATLIRDDSAILGELASAITAFREGTFDSEYDAAIAAACSVASEKGYLI